MSKKEIVIVSAFFDIGRDQYHTAQRSSEKYLEYFKFWARIRNKLIVYCDPENKEKIENIRDEFGLKYKTMVIPVDDIGGVEPELLQKMREIENDPGFQSFRHHEKDPSNLAHYNYVMLLKWWCVNDAAKRLKEDCDLAWIDFGFNHGGSRYIQPEEFDFLWEHEFSEKLNAICLSDPRKVSLADSLQLQFDCFMGCSLVLPKCMAELHWENMKNVMWSLVNCGCMDDDQHLLLMEYKFDPELFEIKYGTWFDEFILNSEQKFTVRQYVAPSFFKRVKNKVRRVFLKRISRLKKTPFVKRMEQKERQYFG